MNLDDFMRRWAPTLADQQEDQANTDLLFTGKNETWEEVVTDTGAHTGVMVAFYPTPEQQQELAVESGEPAGDLHLTLAFLGEVGGELVAEDEQVLIDAVRAWAARTPALSAVTNGHGIFAGGPTPVTYASIDAPALPALRQSLVEALEAAGLPPVQTHGYVPHLTLAYSELRDIQIPPMTFAFDEVVIAFAGHHTRLRLSQTPPEASAALTQPYGAGMITTTERPARPSDMDATPLVLPPVEPDTAKAFVTDINGRTMITAPAVTVAAMKDPTVEDITAEHMLWMHGQFVGAEVPNRNGALWSAGDLEMAKGTVTNGPLNWLHDARHVIGTLAKADFVNPTPMTGRSGQGAQKAASGGGGWVRTSPTTQPHITATAAIWKWIYPDEAYVIQQASDQEMLWYSMECISKEVSCVGEAGCGNTTTYADYMAGAACEHVMQRASVRQFKSPVFLGGAVIVPPTRPGWAEADARVMTTATGLAEAAFEQAGRPDVPASDWEQLMAQLVKFAHA